MGSSTEPRPSLTFRGANVVPLLAFPALATLLFPHALLGTRAFFHYDTWLQNLPFRAWWFEQLRAGHFATWCPGIFAGYPLFAETQTGPLYPPTFLLFSLLPATLAFSWSVWLHFVGAGIGVFLLARRFGLSIASACFAGVTYEASGFLVSHVVHFNLLTGAAWLPWTILAGMSASAGSARAVAAYAVCVACLLLGAHPYATIMALFASAACAVLFTPWRGRTLAVAAFSLGFAVVLGLAIAAVQVFPTREFLPHTSRGVAVAYEFLTFGSFPPWNFATLVVPDLFGTPVDGSYWAGPDWSHFAETCSYVGLLTIPLAVAAVVLRADRATLTFVLGASVSLLLMLGKYTPIYEGFTALPLLQSTRLPARFSLLFTLFTALLAGAGLDAFRDAPAARRRRAIAGGLAALLLLGAAAWWLGGDARSPGGSLAEPGGSWPARLGEIATSAGAAWRRTALFLAITMLALVPMLTAKRLNSWSAIAVLVVAIDLWSWGRHGNPTLPPDAITMPPPAVEALPATSPRPRVVRQGLDEIWTRGTGIPRVDLVTDSWRGNEASYTTGAWALPPNSQLLYGVDSVEGFTSLLPLQWLTWVGLHGAPGAVPRPDLTEAQADLLAVDAVLSSGSGIAGPGWEARELPGDLWLSRNADPMPRVRLANVWSTFEWGDPSVPERIGHPDYDPRRTVLLERTAPPLPDEPSSLVERGGEREVRVDEPIPAAELGPGHWAIEAPRGSSGLVVLAESYDGGWTATNEAGGAIPIHRADGLFVGFFPPANGGRVIVRYAPASLPTGAVVSALGILLAIALATRGGSRGPTRDPDSIRVRPIAIVVVTIAVVCASALHLRDEWRGDLRDASLGAAAARTWTADAFGAFRAGEYDPAARFLYQAIEHAPHDASLAYRIGLVEKARGRPDEARRAFERCLTLNPESSEAQRELDELTVSTNPISR